MARLTDEEILTCYKNALANWRYEGFIVFEKEAANGLRDHLPGLRPKAFKEVLYRHVFEESGKIDQVVEKRENWRSEWSHHYDLRPTVGGVRFYVETRLVYKDFADPDDPTIIIVNVKPA